MTKRAPFFLAALLALAACAAPDDTTLQSAPRAEATVALDAPVMVQTSPLPAHSATSLEECSGDGIGGTGCPDQ